MLNSLHPRIHTALRRNGRQKSFVLASALALLALFLPGSLLAQGTPIGGATPAEVTVTPSAPSLNMGTSVQVTLRVDLTGITGRNASSADVPAVLGGYQVAVAFNNTMLSFTGATGGTSAGYTNTPTFTTPSTANTNGSVTITSSQPDPAAPTGLVTVAVLSFSGIGPGTSNLTPNPGSLSTAFVLGAAGSPALIPGSGTPVSITVNASGNPLPVVSSLIPSSTTAGAGSFTLQVFGSSFIDGSVVRWNGNDRVTTFVSDSELTAVIPASDVVSAGTFPIRVFTAAPGGGLSNAVNFIVNPAGNPIPGIDSLSPPAVTAGSPAFTLTVIGSNFVAGSVVRWAGSNRPTTFVSTTSLQAAITAADVATAGTVAVTVFSPTPGGGLSNSANFTINNASGNPIPTITTINPSTVVAGGAAFTLTVNGTSFVNGAIVRVNGANRTTTFVLATQLTASILASDIATAGNAAITVLNPTPGGGVSNVVNLVVPASGNPVPTVVSLNPASRVAGTPGNFTFTVTGTNFVNGTTIYFNNTIRATSFISGTQVRTTISAASIATVANYPVHVISPGPGGGMSNVVNFVASLPGNNPIPTITSLSPTSVTAGGAGFILTVNGTDLVNGSIVRWNGNNRTTTFVSATRVTAVIPIADIATAGTVAITVFNPTPGGGTSNTLNFIVNPGSGNPIPIISSLAPSSATTGGAGFTLTVNGSSFVNGATVRWNGATRTTTFVSATQLTASISAGDISAGGNFAITVLNPAPGGGVSNTVNFAVSGPSGNPVPAITSLNPSSAAPGNAAFNLVVNGSGFVSGAVVRWNGANRSTSFVSGSQLTASIAAADVATAGTASVTVFNPTPGGGVSNAVNFSISVAPPNQVPAISSLSPSSIGAGEGSFTLRVNGSNFVPSSVIRWNGADRATTYVSASRVTATISSGDISSVGSAQIRVFNPAPGGGLSNPATFSITSGNPVPSITGLNPSTVLAGSGSFTLTILGSDFVDSGARWNGSILPVVSVTSSRIVVTVPAVDILTSGTAFVTVFNPPPGGGVSDPFSITISPGAAPLTADFDFAPGSPMAEQAVAFTDRSTGSVTSWQWNFGDGTASSRNPTHVFAEGGTYRVTLTISDGNSVSTRTRDVVVAAPPNLKFNSLLPVTTQTEGVGGTFWRSEVTLHNFGREAAEVDLVYLPTAGGPSVTRHVSVPAGSTVTYSSLLPDLFGLNTGLGGVIIEARGATRTPQLRVSSRTFTTSSEGTYGQFVPDVGQDLPATTFITGIEWNADFRTNLGFVNKTRNFNNTVLTLYDSDGAVIGSNAVSVPANGLLQQDLVSLFPVLRDGSESGLSLKVQAPAAGWIAAYASVISNRSQDPIFIPAAPAPASRELIIPAVARIPGGGGTFWRSDVTFFNPTNNTMVLVIHLLYADIDNRNAGGRVITLHPGRSVTIEDVLDWLEVGNNRGALQIVASGGSGGGPVVSSKTYTTRSDGAPYGQWVGAVETNQFTSTSIVTGVRSDSTYRTNFGLVNSGNEETEVQLTLHGPTGPIANASVVILPKSQRQFSLGALFPSLNVASLGSVTLRADTDGAQSLFLYGSSVDNRSGDPIFVNGR